MKRPIIAEDLIYLDHAARLEWTLLTAEIDRVQKIVDVYLGYGTEFGAFHARVYENIMRVLIKRRVKIEKMNRLQKNA